MESAIFCEMVPIFLKLLKERLSAIMNFKKATKLTSVLSIALVFVLCFGANMVGAYTMPQPLSVKENTEQLKNSIKQNINSDFTLVKKEYTMEDIKSLNISGVKIMALSENVSIIEGGETLKLEYYIKNQNDYTLQKEFDGGGTRELLCLERVAPLTSDEALPAISVTIPNKADFKVIMADIESGNIYFENCNAKYLSAITKSGRVVINGGSADNFFNVETDTGDVYISEISLKGEPYATFLETQTGTIKFQPKDSIKNYHFIIDTEKDAKIVINDNNYEGGEYSINSTGLKGIAFDSKSGSFIVKDLSMGKLILSEPTALNDSVNNSNLILIRKEYTANDLQKLDITGIYINVPSENIVVS